MAVTSAYADIDDASRNVGAIPFDQADAGGSQGPTGDGAPFGAINSQTASPGLSVDQQRALAETASAYRYTFPKLLEARSRFRNDTDYPTLPQRWANESEQIIDAGVSRISDDGVRANVRRRLQITITPQHAEVEDWAFRRAADAHAAERDRLLGTLIDHVTLDRNDALTTGGLHAFYLSVDDALARGFLTPERAEIEKRCAAQDLCAAEYSLMADQDPARALRELESGTDAHPLVQTLPTETKDALIEKAEVSKQAKELDGQQAPSSDAPGAVQAADDVEARYAADLLSKQPTNTAADIYADNTLTPEAKRRLLELAKSALEPEPPAELSEATARELIDRIRRPDGDPEQISSLAPIFDAFNAGTLTKADFKVVTEKLAGARPAEGELPIRQRAISVDGPTSPPGSSSDDLPHEDNDPATKSQLINVDREPDGTIERDRRGRSNPKDVAGPEKPDGLSAPDSISNDGSAINPRLSRDQTEGRSADLPSSLAAQPGSLEPASIGKNAQSTPDATIPAAAGPRSDGSSMAAAATESAAADDARNAAAERLRQAQHHAHLFAAEQPPPPIVGREISGPETVGRALADALSLGTAPAIAGIRAAGLTTVPPEVQKALWAHGPEPVLGALISGLTALGYENLIAPALGIDTQKTATAAYRKARDEWQADTEAAETQHPLAFHATSLAAMLAPLGAISKAARLSRDRNLFFSVYPELLHKVWVHHAIPRFVLTMYPGRFTLEEIHALKNLRGIPNSMNRILHLIIIHGKWSQFYIKYPHATRRQIFAMARKIDQDYGHKFLPSLGKKQ